MGLRFAICGYDHGATSYGQHLFNSAGVACGHEVCSRTGVRAGIEKLGYAADIGYGIARHLNHPFIRRATVIHWLRHPVDHINSWLRAGWHHAIEMWARDFLKPAKLPTDSVGYLTARLYHTNRFMDERSNVVMRAEDRAANLELVGLEPGGFDNPSMNRHEERQRRGRKGDVMQRLAAGPQRIGWDDLPQELQEQYASYGYEPSDTSGLRHAPDASIGAADRPPEAAPGDVSGMLRQRRPGVVVEWK